MGVPRWSVALLCSALAAVVLGQAPSQAAKAPVHQVVVLTQYGLVAKFKTAKCRKREGGFDLLTKEVDGGYSLFASIDHLDKNQDTYPVTQGKSDPFVSVIQAGTDLRYNNSNVPPFPAPGFGQIQFDKRHPKLVGVGYSHAYTHDASDAATITGVLKCKYPKRR